MKKDQKHTFGKGQGGTALAVRINPTTGKSKVTGVLPDGEVKIDLNSGDYDENTQLITFLANLLNVAKQNIEIVVGMEKREKIIALIGLDPQTVQELLKPE